jgi:hypothetical protein
VRLTQARRASDKRNRSTRGVLTHILVEEERIPDAMLAAAVQMEPGA